MKQPLFSSRTGSNDGTYDGVTSILEIDRGTDGTAMLTLDSTNENSVSVLIPIDGSFSKFYVNCTVAPGAGNSWTILLRVNESDTALSVTISDSSTSGSDTSNTVSVSAGDLVAIRVNPSSGPAAARFSWGVLFDGGAQGAILPAVTNNNFTNSIAQSWYPFGRTYTESGGPIEVDVIFPTAGTLKNLRVNLTAAPGVGNQLDFDVYLNDVATVLSVSVNGTATTGSDLSDTIAIVAGDRVSVRTDPISSPTPSVVRFGMQFAPTTDGEAPVFSVFQPSGIAGSTDTLFVGLEKVFIAGASLTESDVQSPCPGSVTFSKLYLYMEDIDGNPQTVGNGKHFNFNVRKNGNSQLLSVELIQGMSSSNNLVNSFSAVAGDLLNYGADASERAIIFHSKTNDDPIIFKDRTNTNPVIFHNLYDPTTIANLAHHIKISMVAVVA